MLSKTLADWWTDRRRRRTEQSVTDERWEIVQVAMPGLLNQMRADLARQSLVREFVPLPHRGVQFHHGGITRFEYYGDEHPALEGQITILTGYGYITDVRVRPDAAIYRMTPTFVELLERKD